MIEAEVASPSSAQTEAEAFDARVRPLLDSMLGYFARRVRPADDAADCLSEALTVLWRRRREMPIADDELCAYAFGVAKGVLANQRRGQWRRAALQSRVRDHVMVQASSPSQPGDGDEVRAALLQLSPEDRELLTLIAWDGLTPAEAAVVMGVAPAAARKRLSRALARLREALQSP
jgi:RNA polymerase sigma-70 factor (ECF subfamily)